MELVQQNIHMDRISKEGSVQITLEDDVNLPEMKPDISSLCMEKGNVVVEEVRPGTDAVMVRGRLVFDILYHTQEDGGRLDCLDGKLLFEEKIRLDGLTAGDNVTVCGKIDDISVAVINSRKLSVQSVVTLSATVEEIYDETLPVGVSGEEGEDPQYRLVPMEFTQVCLCRKDVMRVKEELGLPQNYPNIGQILWKNVEFGEMNFRLGEEKITATGELRVFVLYEGEGENSSPQIYEEPVPISAEIACYGCREGEALDVRYGMGQWELTIKADEDGEQRLFALEATVELKLCVYEDKRMDVLTDIYGIKREISGSRKSVQLEKLLRSVTGKTKVTEHVKLGAGDQILQLVHSDGQVSLSSVSPAQEGIVLRGMLGIKVLYVTGDDEKPYGCLKTGIPFEYTMEIPGMTENAQTGPIQTELEQLSVTMLDGEELDVKGVICFSTTAMERVEAQVLGEISQMPLDAEKLASLPGMAVYVVKQGDDLWTIGKKYYVPVESIMDLNDLDQQELKPGQKLLVVKGGV